MNVAVPALAHWVGTPHTLHALHHPERAWPQTNCSLDLMVGLVAAHGLDPVWMMGFTLTQDFEGDHFGFFKVPSEDLEALYGLSVHELAVWDDLLGHVTEQVARGRVVLLEVDGYHLPDTRGVTYHEAHGKTTIGIFALDAAERTLHYFHNEARSALNGDDFDGALQRLPAQANLLMPYTEVVKANHPPAADPAALALQQLRHHWQRRPRRNPFLAYAEALPTHLTRLAERDQAYFHAYAFNTVRQFGANFGLMEAMLSRWPQPPFQQAADCARRLADGAKVLQFKLARAASRQRFDGLVEAVLALGATYDTLMQHLSEALALPLVAAPTAGAAPTA